LNWFPALDDRQSEAARHLWRAQPARHAGPDFGHCLGHLRLDGLRGRVPVRAAGHFPSHGGHQRNRDQNHGREYPCPAVPAVGVNPFWTHIPQGLGRNATSQAGYQLFGIAVTLLIAIGGGILTGLYGSYFKELGTRIF